MTRKIVTETLFQLLQLAFPPNGNMRVKVRLRDGRINVIPILIPYCEAASRSRPLFSIFKAQAITQARNPPPVSCLRLHDLFVCKSSFLLLPIEKHSQFVPDFYSKCGLADKYQEKGKPFTAAIPLRCRMNRWLKGLISCFAR